MTVTRAFIVILAATMVLLGDRAALAQGDAEEASIRDVLRADEQLEQVIDERIASGDKLDMSTPLNSLLLLQEALRADDLEHAAQFLDMRFLPAELQGESAADLLRKLRYVWTRQIVLDISSVSDDAEGHLDDGLPSYRDVIAEIELSSGMVPIYMQRIPGESGERIWKFSNATVARIPEMWSELGYGPVAAYLRDQLPEVEFFGMENWQLVFLVAALVLGWPLATLICLLLEKILVRHRGPFMDAISRFLRIQLRIFLFIMIVRFVLTHMGLSIRTMALMQSTGVIYIAVIILLLGIINLVQGYQARRLIQSGQAHYVALLGPAATVLKALVIVTVFLVWADDAGYDMTTVIAGLGVGSLAVALAAQKTLENLIGAITIYTARPIKPGDFCRFGSTIGTVEEIGLRSTVLRTLNRTRVSIPNAVFSAEEVENFTERDRIRYFRYLRLEIGPAEQLRELLDVLRKLVAAHPMAVVDTVSVRFDDISDNTAHIRLDAGIRTSDFQEYLRVAEELNLQIIEAVQARGLRFSGPGQQLTLHGLADSQDALGSMTGEDSTR